MKSFILLTPFNASLLERLSGKEVIFSAEDVSQIIEIQRASQGAGINLHAVYIKGFRSLSNLKPDSKWNDIPIALEIESIGKLQDFLKIREALLKSNLRIYMPVRSRTNCVEVRILSSLGFNCCAMVASDEHQIIDWEALRDLAVYSIYTRRPHGEIDPFSYILEHYHASSLTNFKAVYFDDPSAFLHVSENGRLSLSAKDLKQGRYLNVEIEQCEKVRELEAYWAATHEWKAFFLERTRCSQCKAWRICEGAFAWSGLRSGCDLVLQEVLEGAEYYQQAKSQVKQLWRL